MDARIWNRLMAPILRRIRLIVTRGVVRLVDPTQLMQQLQVELLKGEVLDGVEHFEPYGFTSHPLAGAEVLAVSLNGRRENTIALCVADRRYRKQSLAPGESALHNHLGDYIVIKQDRTIEVYAGVKVKVIAPTVEVLASTKVILTTPLTEVSGNMTVGGTLAAAGAISSSTSVADPSGTMTEMRDTFNVHAHPGGVVTPQMT